MNLRKSKMDKRITLIFTLICAATLAGCNGAAPQDVPDAELVGTLWTLESIKVPGEPIFISGSPPATAVIRFAEDSKLEGGAFCNTYGASYQITDDGEINIEVTFRTKILCSLSAKEEHYYQALDLANSYDIEGNVITLYYGSISVLKFRNME